MPRSLVLVPLVLLLACGDDGAPATPDAGRPDTGVAGGDDGGAPDAGDPGSGCEPPGPDVPLDLPVVEDGQFRRVEAFPLPGFRDRQVTVYLPEGYDPSRRYPVLYFTDGQLVFGLGYRTHEAMEMLVDAGAIEPHLIVAVYSDDVERTAELTPDVDPRWTMGEPGRGDAFADAVLARVKPFVDARFSTRCGREHTTIAGFSLGGLMCLHLATRDPDVFGRAMCFSPSIWWNERSVLDRFAAAAGPLPIRLWLDVGTLEWWSDEAVAMLGDDSFFFDHPVAIRAARDAALARGMTLGDDLGYFEHIDQPHDHLAIRARIASALAFVAGDDDLSTATPTGYAFDVWHDAIDAAPAGAPGAVTTRTTASVVARYADPYTLALPNRGFTFGSSDESIATIDAEGTIQGVSPGTVTIEATDGTTTWMDTLEVRPAPTPP